MPAYHLEHLDREAYIASVATIQDPRSAGFARQALAWWDRNFSWKVHGCVALTDEAGDHLSYIFYKIDRYRRYMVIHNLFTPLAARRKGYAQLLLKMVFAMAAEREVGRFKLSSVSQSLDFYLSLGFSYWGLTGNGDYYCDLPVPTEGLADLGDLVLRSDVRTLTGGRMETIYEKIRGNVAGLSEEQRPLFEKDRRKLGERFMLEEFCRVRNGPEEAKAVRVSG